MQRGWRAVLFPVALFLGACTTPYEPPVLVYRSSTFPGLADVVAQSGARPVDVIVIHGMCTHYEKDGIEAIERLVNAVDESIPVRQSVRLSSLPPTAPEIRVVEASPVPMAGGIARFSALIWSPLTTALKQQLLYDNTGEPTDCSAPGECKPSRAKVNGDVKDFLLNDCLADAMIYQGRSRNGIRQKMSEAISHVVERAQIAARSAGTDPGPLVLVSESLGSKIAYDALEMLMNSQSALRGPAAAAAVHRLRVLYMAANQLPILNLSEQDAVATRRQVDGPDDALHRILRSTSPTSSPIPDPASAPSKTLVAFSDPNDLLSYRLLPSRYAMPGVAVADVLVSNAPTYLGLLEHPFKAHTDYTINGSVSALIACGWPRSTHCK